MNIIGEGLAPYVKNQIQTRQKIYGSLNRTSEQLLYLDNRSGFVRAISGVNIGPTFNPAGDDLKAIIKNYGGDKLAKNFILFGGTTNESKVLKAGIPTELLGTNYINNLAYGFGGLEFGIRPMPGIISMTNKSEGMGSLETTTLRIKAWNRLQLEIIDLMYMRLGYGILVEWGNSNYYNNDNVYQPDNLNSLSSEFLAGKYNVQGLLDAIEKKKKASSGNYDAVYGKVVNFNWTFVDDGSYDITVILRSVGDVVEAFQTAVFNYDGDSVDTDELTPEEFRRIATFNAQRDQEANDLASGDLTLPQAQQVTRFKFSKDENGNVQVTDTNQPPPIDDAKNSHIINRLFYNVRQKFTNGDPNIISNKAYQTAKLQPSGDSTVTYLEQIFQGNNTEGQTESKQYYIRLGSLLSFFEQKILPKYKQGENSTPILNIDYTLDTNLAYTTPVQVSSNPKICVVNVNVPSSDGTSQFLFAPQGEKYQTTIAKTLVGQIMNIYVNFEHIVNIIDGNGDPKNQTTLIKFFEVLCNDLSVALGSINTFRPFIDKTTNTLKIIDEAKIPNKNSILKALKKPSPVSDPEIKIYGYDFPQNIIETNLAGFVREFKLTTQIPPGFAEIITIGAQSAGAVVGEDATALSRLNRGLEDRIKPAVVNAIDPNKSTSKIEALNDKFKFATEDFYEFIAKIGIDPNNPPGDNPQKRPLLIDEQLYSYTNLASTFYKYIESKASIEQGSASGTIGFIPVGVGLTLDGISGLKIYNAIKVDTRYLPSNYPDTMEFIITGLSHTVENNVWTTELQTVMQPTVLADVKAVVPKFTNKQPPITTCGTPNINTLVPPPNNPADNRRFNAMKAAYNAVFDSRPDGDAALCARYTYNLAFKYIKSLLNQKSPDQTLTPSGGNANDVTYWSNLSKLGYTQVIIGENLTKEQAIAQINGLQYNIGDVVAYKAYLPGGEGTPEASFTYGHTQIYTGTGISPSGWASSKPKNYGSSFVYNSKSYTCYKVVLFRAPNIPGTGTPGGASTPFLLTPTVPNIF
jgi:hypothetical protein